MRIIFIIVFALILVAFMGCQQERNRQYVQNADRVFLHTPQWFSFVKDEKIISVTHHDVRLRYDLKPNEKIWGREEEEVELDNVLTRRYIYVIHLHSPKEINGGGWSDEDSSGSTIAIE